MKLLLETWRDNDLAAFAIATGVLLGALLALLAARFVAARLMAAVSRRTGSAVGEGAGRAIGKTRLSLLLPLALLAAASVLEVPERLGRLVEIAAVIGLVLQAGLWASHLIEEWLDRRTASRAGTEGDAVTALALLGFAARVAVWVLVLLVILDHMGFNITALVAGLGIGGVAVALALQNILGDLFASLSIVLDKPFVVGDFIVVDNLRGTVERVGVKSTRVRSLDGEGLVFSNSELLKSRIRNFKQLTERRVLFTVGVTYGTAPEKLRAIPPTLRRIVESQPLTRFDRAHFKEFADSALTFEVVYYVLDPDYNRYMDTQQEINLAVFERFAAEGIEFAFPTRTLHLADPLPPIAAIATGTA